jgi:Protein of unknown function (DUF2934)
LTRFIQEDDMVRQPTSRTTKAVKKPLAESRRKEPDEHKIRARAHAIWIEEGKPEGRRLEHWERARRELEEDDESE